MQLNDGVRYHQLVTVPRPPQEPHTPDPAAGQLFAALSASHAELIENASAAPMIVVAWQRPAGSRQLQVLVGGRPCFPPAARTTHGPLSPVLYPPGSTGKALTAHEVARLWRDFPVWVRCPGQPDPLWGVDPQGRQSVPQRGGFDDYVAHLGEGFVWLVVAEPLPPDAVDIELLRLANHIPRLRQRENSELDRVALERAQGRYRELSRAHTSGVWNVHVLVGGADVVTARRAAAVLCGSSDLADLPYTLAPGDKPGTLEEVCQTPITNGQGPCSPFPATAELLAAFARPPRRELPGIRLVEPATFDLTPEHHGDIDVGHILDEADQAVGSFTVSADTLNRHTFVAGATGAGKSQTVRHLLEGIHHAGIPWLVIEPAKAEYAHMAGRIGGDHVTVIRPGDPDAVPAGLNPLEPEPGFPLQTHIDMVRALFLAAFEAQEPFPQVLAQALTRCYTDLGWNLVLSQPRLPHVTPKYPSLADLQRTALDVVTGIGYGKEITDNVRGFIDVRIGSLRLGTPGRFFEACYPINITDLLNRNVVLEIEDIGNDHDKAFFIGTVLIRLFEHLRQRHTHGNQQRGLRHITVVEEAHRLLKRVEPGTPAARAVELFTSLLAEIRAYGEGIIVAEQIPAKITPDVIKNTALKIVHRLPAADDRDTLGATMNLDQAQSRHIVSLPPGRAVVFTDGMDRPIRINVPLGEDREDATTASHTITVTPPPGLPLTSPHPYSLREIAQAAVLAEDPRLTLWIELLTTAHLVGRPSPQPHPTWLTELATRANPHILDYAIAYRIQGGIDARYSGLAHHYQPETLATHLAQSAHHVLHTTAPACDGTEVQWQAGRYRWADIHRALRIDHTPKNQPHPDTAAWTKRGLHLSGPTQTDQLNALRRHPDSWLPPTTTITGGQNPTAYEHALTQLSRAHDPQQRLQEATTFLHLTTPWPLTAYSPPNTGG